MTWDAVNNASDRPDAVGGRLEGRLAVVAGATRGIGGAVAARLRAMGARVLGTGTSVTGSVPQGGQYRGVDLSSEAPAEAFAEDLRAALPDILVNNAGVNRLAPFAETSHEHPEEPVR